MVTASPSGDSLRCAASATLVTPALALLGLVSPKAEAGGSPESSCPQHLPDSIALDGPTSTFGLSFGSPQPPRDLRGQEEGVPE